MKTFLKNFLKGFVIGATMTVPGISGGTMAILLRIYEDLVGAVGSFFRAIKRNFVFLVSVALGGALGAWLLTSPMLWLNKQFPQPVMYGILGIVAGSLPTLLKKAHVKRITSSVLLFPLIGAAVVVGLFFVPEGLINMTFTDWWAYAVLGIVGFFMAIALVLPGISFTYVLYLLGIYDSTMTAVKTFNFSILIPMAIGLAIGTVVISKIMQVCMVKHPQGTYLIIIGFVVSSLILQMFDANIGWPQGYLVAVCACTFVGGAVVVLGMSWLANQIGAPKRRQKSKK